MKVVVVQPINKDTKEVSLLDVETGEYQLLDTMEAINSGDIVLGWVVGDDDSSDMVYETMPEALSEIVRRNVRDWQA